ncbi:MAG: hypothetical protein KGS72_06265 [Cyanobacteria bacterium REEB67]|nr:hypothetical protein [Cyanobacteria bacterium REEB67]
MSDETANRNASDDLKNKILSSINTTFTGEATSRWITAMKDEAFDSVEEAVTVATPDNKLNQSMAAVIDKLFDNFKRYSFEYNRIQENRELEINCERPASMRTTAEYADMGKPIKYCLGHLAARHWAMIIQGEENRILVYVTPIEYLIGFKPTSGEFTPYLEMRLARAPGKQPREFVWSVGGEPLSVDSLPVLARRLFTQLVKVTKGEAEYTEPFALSAQEEKVALAQSEAAPIDRSFEDDSTNLLGQSGKKADLSARTFVVSAEQNTVKKAESASVTDDRPQINALLNVPATVPSAVSASSSYPQVAAAIANGEPKALTAPASAPSTPASAAPLPQTASSLPTAAPSHAISQNLREITEEHHRIQPPAADVMQSAAPTPPEPEKKTLESTDAPKNNQSRAGGNGLDREMTQAKGQIAQSLKGLFDSLDGAIKGLTAVGLEAMSNDDIDTVSAVMKQTKNLKALRDSVVGISKEWQKSIEP